MVSHRPSYRAATAAAARPTRPKPCKNTEGAAAAPVEPVDDGAFPAVVALSAAPPVSVARFVLLDPDADADADVLEAAAAEEPLPEVAEEDIAEDIGPPGLLDGVVLALLLEAESLLAGAGVEEALPLPLPLPVAEQLWGLPEGRLVTPAGLQICRA